MTSTRTAREAWDRGEIDRARRGDRRAFVQLYERHAPLSWRLALVAGRDRRAAEAAVVSAFANVLGHSEGRDLIRFAPVDAQLLRAARESAVEQAARLDAPTGLEPISATPHTDTLRAFDLLPERSRTVLWLGRIEQIDLSTTAAVLGATKQSTADLTTRAFAGLREQLAHQAAGADLRHQCRETTSRLGGYVARALPSRETIRVRRHLDRCEECRARLDQLDDVTPHLRNTLPALPISIESLALGAWLARTHESAGPIGLRMPGGTLAPAWVERSLAGATAAIVSLGISAAVLLGGRDGGGNPVPPEVATAPTDGEQALGRDGSSDDSASEGAGTSTPDAPALSSDDDASGGEAASGGSTDSSDGTSGAAPSSTPRGGSAPTSPGTAPSNPSPTPSPSPSPSDPTDPPSPTSSDPVDELVGVVDGVVDEVCGLLAPACDSLPVAAPLPQISVL